MRNSFRLSVAALLAAMLVSAPAGAVSLNLGNNNGDGLLNLGGDGGLDANVNVTTGNGVGDVLDLGNTNANVSVNTGNSGPAAAIDVNTGNGGAGGSSGTDAIVDLNLGGDGNDDLLDLFGNEPTTADVDLGNTGNVSVDLFGSTGEVDADVLLGGSSGDAVVDLFGNGDGADATIDLGMEDDLLTNTAGIGILDDLFGPSGPGMIDDGTNGTPAGDGGLFGPATPGGVGNSAGGNGGVQVAAIGDTGEAACFSPNADQIGNLINRHAYTASTMASWRGATQLKIVKIDLCDSAISKIENSANIAALQDYLAGNPTFSARLKSKGYGADDVIAVDRNGKTLIVYVT